MCARSVTQALIRTMSDRSIPAFPQHRNGLIRSNTKLS